MVNSISVIASTISSEVEQKKQSYVRHILKFWYNWIVLLCFELFWRL